MRDPRKTIDRRAMMAGAGGVGALTAAAIVLPGAQQAVAPMGAVEPIVPPDTAAGYRLTEHVKKYYRTTRI